MRERQSSIFETPSTPTTPALLPGSPSSSQATQGSPQSQHQHLQRQQQAHPMAPPPPPPQQPHHIPMPSPMEPQVDPFQLHSLPHRPRPQPAHHQHPSFPSHIEHLRQPLHPLLSVQTGQAHGAFPPSLLHYHLLSEPQLDELASHFHQAEPGAFSLAYPAPVVGRWAEPGGIEAKRRRFGRFIGLRGCELSPDGAAAGVAAGEWSEDQEEREWLAMKAWVERRIRAGAEEELQKEIRRGKGF